VPLPLTRSVAPPLSGLWDLTPHRQRKYQGPLRSPPRQKQRAYQAQRAFHRRRTLRGVACAKPRPVPPPTSATNSIHEHSPGSP
jgi:hypothetical protein